MAFLVVTPCILAGCYCVLEKPLASRFRLKDSEDGDSRLFRNVGNLFLDVFFHEDFSIADNRVSSGRTIDD
jgi:hypothetical protein